MVLVRCHGWYQCLTAQTMMIYTMPQVRPILSSFRGRTIKSRKGALLSFFRWWPWLSHSFSTFLVGVLKGRDVIHYCMQITHRPMLVSSRDAPHPQTVTVSSASRTSSGKSFGPLLGSPMLVASDANLSDDPSHQPSDMPSTLQVLESMGAVRLSFDLLAHRRWSVKGDVEIPHTSAVARCSGG